MPWFSVLIADAEREALRGISHFDRGARAAARRVAHRAAENRAKALLEQAIERQQAEQREADEAFEDAMSSSDERLRRALTRLPSVQRGQIVINGVDDRTASARVGMQTASMVPARKPVLSAAGNWTLPKVTKTERSSWIRELAAAHALLAAKEIVVGVPGVLTVSIEVADADKGYAVVLRATLTQAALRTARWELGAWQLMTHLDPQYEAKLHGRTGELLQLPGE